MKRQTYPAGFPGRSRAPRRPSRTIEREHYFSAALDILAESTGESLTALRLCERLKVTKGSFYHHFDSMEAFVQGFADHREKILSDLLGLIAAQPDPVLRLASALNMIAQLPHEAETAIRAWSNTNQVLGASQRRIDRSWIDVASQIAAALTEDSSAGRMIGVQAVAMLVGLQQLGQTVDRLQLIRTLAAFAEKSCDLKAKLMLTGDTEIPVVSFDRKDNDMR